VHVQRREKDADLLPVAGRRRARFDWPRDFHFAVGRRQHNLVELAFGRNGAFRIAKEEGEKRAERDERDRKDPRDRRAGKNRKKKRATDERRARRIEAQLRVLHAMAPQDAFHPILQLQFFLFEGDFFDLLGL
jgi:hypothetical protein